MAVMDPDAPEEPIVCPDPSAHLPNPAMFEERGSGEGDDIGPSSRDTGDRS